MSDHQSGPRALADPVVDITDVFVFPSPQRPGSLVLALDVFPNAGRSALFSDAVNYRFRVRTVEIAPRESSTMFNVGAEEYVFICRFADPGKHAGDEPPIQEGTCTAPNGQSVSFRVNDEQGGTIEGMRAYAGLRMDPFFFDAFKALETIKTGRLAFVRPGTSRQCRQNVLSIVLEVDVTTMFGTKRGPLFAVVAETTTIGSITARLERFGRPLIKSLGLALKQFDPINRDLEIRDLYNQEDAFGLGPSYLGAFRSRLNANLSFWDRVDGATDWPPDADGDHPLTKLLLNDFMVVDVSKPFGEDSYLEIEQATLKGAAHATCGGRSPNDDIVDTYLTLLVNAAKGPRISDGVDQQAVRASRTFPYLAPPDPNPPPKIEI
jgi:hypothetical protein